MTLYQLSKLAGRYNRNLTPYETEKYKKDASVFDGDNCVSNAFHFLLKFKGEERKVNNKIVEYTLQLDARNGSGFDTWITLNNLPCDKHTVDIIKNGKGINSLRVFNSYIQNNKKMLNI